MKKVGILALQGSFAEHAKILEQLSQKYIFVRSKQDLENITHLIIPGGESTTLEKLLWEFDMWGHLKNKKLNIFGTCAGAILCQKLGLDIEIERNAYGAQQASFIAELDSKIFKKLQGVFIRAPKFKVQNKKIKILAHYKQAPVLVQQNNFLVASFHPELRKDTRVHAFFLTLNSD
mgnify:CR=1 FL=1